MARYRKEYSLYSHHTKNGKSIWYYRTYDGNGNRTSGRSTGETSKTKAANYCNRLIKEGRLLPTKEITFAKYAENWWLWDKCNYIRNRRLRQDNGKPAISRRHADDQRQIL